MHANTRDAVCSVVVLKASIFVESSRRVVFANVHRRKCAPVCIRVSARACMCVCVGAAVGGVAAIAIATGANGAA